MIGSEASTHGCFCLIELRGCIWTGVRNGMSCGVRDGLPSHTKNNMWVGAFARSNARRLQYSHRSSNPSNLICVVCVFAALARLYGCYRQVRVMKGLGRADD